VTQATLDHLHGEFATDAERADPESVSADPYLTRRGIVTYLIVAESPRTVRSTQKQFNGY